MFVSFICIRIAHAKIKQFVLGGDSSSRSINCIQYMVYCVCVCVWEFTTGRCRHIYLDYLLGVCCWSYYSFAMLQSINIDLSIDEGYVEIRKFEKFYKHRVASICLLINKHTQSHTHTHSNSHMSLEKCLRLGWVIYYFQNRFES